MSFLQKLRAVDFYRKVHKDYTEATLSGAGVSVIAAVVMILLFLAELKTYMAVQTATSIIIDQSEDETLQIHFNITLLHLQCQLADISVVDVIGTSNYNITRDIKKWHLDPTGQPVAPARADMVPPKYEDMDTPPLSEGTPPAAEQAPHEHSDTELLSRHIKEGEWDDAIRAQDVLMVNFYAPWCPWSRKLQPVWEHSAGVLLDKYGRDKIAFGRVDCTDQASVRLCQQQHINAFPSIRVYRHGANKHQVKNGQGVVQGHNHEAYYGDRTADAIVAFAEKVLAEDLSTHEKHDEVVKAASAGDQRAQMAVTGNGCRLEGSVRVRKVPGNLVVGAATEGLSFAGTALDVSHTINHFSFGHHQEKSSLFLEKTSRLDGRDYGTPLDRANSTYEHYLKVVLNTYERLNGEKLNSYEFTSNSHQYTRNTVPTIKFTYDISPMQVIVSETHQHFYHFATSVCAIVGGVFTVAGIADAILHQGLQSFTKKLEIGKAY